MQSKLAYGRRSIHGESDLPQMSIHRATYHKVPVRDRLLDLEQKTRAVFPQSAGWAFSLLCHTTS